MTPADITLAAFTLCNSLRVVAYVPQITRAATDQGGAEAISFATWSLFLFSNVSATAYALVNKDDWMMASMFLGNAVGCAAILLIGAWKRGQHRNRRTDRVVQVRAVTTGCIGRRRDAQPNVASVPLFVAPVQDWTSRSR